MKNLVFLSIATFCALINVSSQIGTQCSAQPLNLPTSTTWDDGQIQEFLPATNAVWAGKLYLICEAGEPRFYNSTLSQSTTAYNASLATISNYSVDTAVKFNELVSGILLSAYANEKFYIDSDKSHFSAVLTALQYKMSPLPASFGLSKANMDLLARAYYYSTVSGERNVLPFSSGLGAADTVQTASAFTYIMASSAKYSFDYQLTANNNLLTGSGTVDNNTPYPYGTTTPGSPSYSTPTNGPSGTGTFGISAGGSGYYGNTSSSDYVNSAINQYASNSGSTNPKARYFYSVNQIFQSDFNRVHASRAYYSTQAATAAGLRGTTGIDLAGTSPVANTFVPKSAVTVLTAPLPVVSGGTTFYILVKFDMNLGSIGTSSQSAFSTGLQSVVSIEALYDSTLNPITNTADANTALFLQPYSTPLINGDVGKIQVTTVNGNVSASMGSVPSTQDGSFYKVGAVVGGIYAITGTTNSQLYNCAEFAANGTCITCAGDYSLLDGICYANCAEDVPGTFGVVVNGKNVCKMCTAFCEACLNATQCSTCQTVSSFTGTAFTLLADKTCKPDVAFNICTGGPVTTYGRTVTLLDKANTQTQPHDCPTATHQTGQEIFTCGYTAAAGAFFTSNNACVLKDGAVEILTTAIKNAVGDVNVNNSIAATLTAVVPADPRVPVTPANAAQVIDNLVLALAATANAAVVVTPTNVGQIFSMVATTATGDSKNVVGTTMVTAITNLTTIALKSVSATLVAQAAANGSASLSIPVPNSTAVITVSVFKATATISSSVVPDADLAGVFTNNDYYVVGDSAILKSSVAIVNGQTFKVVSAPTYPQDAIVPVDGPYAYAQTGSLKVDTTVASVNTGAQVVYRSYHANTPAFIATKLDAAEALCYAVDATSKWVYVGKPYIVAGGKTDPNVSYTYTYYCQQDYTSPISAVSTKGQFGDADAFGFSGVVSKVMTAVTLFAVVFGTLMQI